MVLPAVNTFVQQFTCHAQHALDCFLVLGSFYKLPLPTRVAHLWCKPWLDGACKPDVALYLLHPEGRPGQRGSWVAVQLHDVARHLLILIAVGLVQHDV